MTGERRGPDEHCRAASINRGIAMKNWGFLLVGTVLAATWLVFAFPVAAQTNLSMTVDAEADTITVEGATDGVRVFLLGAVHRYHGWISEMGTVVDSAVASGAGKAVFDFSDGDVADGVPQDSVWVVVDSGGEVVAARPASRLDPEAGGPTIDTGDRSGGTITVAGTLVTAMVVRPSAGAAWSIVAADGGALDSGQRGSLDGTIEIAIAEFENTEDREALHGLMVQDLVVAIDVWSLAWASDEGGSAKAGIPLTPAAGGVR